MIDTIGVEFPSTYIPYNIYSKWDDSKHHRNGSYIVSQYGFTEYLSNSSSIRYTYLPHIKSGLLKLEFSLPHLIFGNNTQMVNDIEKAIELANSKIPKTRGIKKINLWNGNLYRLDICNNFYVGELVPWYIKAILPLEYPYRKTRPYTSQGVQFENKRVVLRIYDKSRERKDNKDPLGASRAYGILRVETELKRIFIQKLTHKKQPTLRSITASWAKDVIQNELKKLNLIDQSIGTVNSTFNFLREIYDSWEAFTFIGVLCTKIAYPSIELLAQHANLHKNSIGRHLQKKFAQNGIPQTLTEHIEPLPPLTFE